MRTLLLCVFLCLLGCGRKTSEPIDCLRIELPLKQEENKLNLSEIVDSIQYIPLETREECLIGSIDKILLTDENNYLIVDKEISSSIYLFDASGTFLNKIGNRGEANSEYTMMEDVSYYNGSVYVWDSASRKVVSYSEEGHFISSFGFDYVAYSMAAINENEFAFCCDYAPNRKLEKGGQYPSMMVYDKNKKDVCPYLFFDSTLSPYAFQATLNNLCNNNLYLPLNDTIYKVTDAGLERKYVLSYKESYMENKHRYIEKSQTGHVATDDAMKSYNEDRFPHLITYFECDKLDVFFMRMCDYLYYGFYYPDSGIYKECSAVKEYPVVNDIDGVASFSPRYSRGDVLYGLADPACLLDGKMDLLTSSSRKVDLQEDSNPVMVKMFVKK